MKTVFKGAKVRRYNGQTLPIDFRKPGDANLRSASGSMLGIAKKLGWKQTKGAVGKDKDWALYTKGGLHAYFLMHTYEDPDLDVGVLHLNTLPFRKA